MREDQIIRGCLKGKYDCQRALYDLHKVSMFMLCMRYMPTREDAEDVLQEGFIKIYRDLHQYNPERGALHAWMRRVMLNTALQHLRVKKHLISPLEIENFADLHPVNDDVFSDMTAKELTALIQQLPTGYRVVFNMYVVEGYSHQEIAEELGISVNTSKSQLFKAKAMLRKQVKQIFATADAEYEDTELQR